MIKLDKVSKTYNVGEDNEFKALKDISIDFPSKGFVFLLGKSGSGKSTLLNVIGGLDSFDAGNIKIKNKSLKDFSKTSIDSYRNTYVGFIFQDYNLIEDYSVSQNIELALNLQGEKSEFSKEKTIKLLKDVGLDESAASKKINQLSGGQKQRVSIARALVKQPEIILADEPTGALDSDTGTQILDILRNIADERLVIMVSHDIGYALKYADQIIELSDGEVISNSYNEKVLNLGNDNTFSKYDGEVKVINVPDGTNLTENHNNEIKGYLLDEKNTLFKPLKKGTKLSKEKIDDIKSNLDGDLYIALMKNESISDNNIAKQSIDEKTSEYKTIKSKLPLGDAFHMAVDELYNKKFRMLFSVMIFVVAITIFGFVGTVNDFDYNRAITNSYAEAGLRESTLVPTVDSANPWDLSGERLNIRSFFTTDLYDSLSSNVDLPLAKVYDFEMVTCTKYCGEGISYNPGIVYGNVITGALIVDDITDFGMSYAKGGVTSIPTKGNEILITDYIADPLASISSTEQNKDYTNYISKQNKILLGDQYYTIVGVVDTDYEEYLVLNEPDNMSPSEYKRKSNLFFDKHDNVYSNVIVGEAFLNKYTSTIESVRDTGLFIEGDGSSESGIQVESLSEYLNTFDSVSALKGSAFFIKDGITKLENNQVILTEQAFIKVLNACGYDSSFLQVDTRTSNVELFNIANERGLFDVSYGSCANTYVSNTIHEQDTNGFNEYSYREYEIEVVGLFYPSNYNSTIYNFDKYISQLEEEGIDYVHIDKDVYLSYWDLENDFYNTTSDGNGPGADGEVTSNEMYIAYLKDLLGSSAPEYDGTQELWYYQNDLKEAVENAGYVEGETYLSWREASDYTMYLYNRCIGSEDGVWVYNNISSSIIVSDDFLAEYSSITHGNFTRVYAYLSDDKSDNKEFFDITSDMGFKHITFVASYVDTFYDSTQDLAGILSIVSWVSIVFIGLLIFYNISGSVLSKKKDIGTLRAVGARGSDVSKIFILEGLMIALATLILSLISVFITAIIVNNSVVNDLGLPLRLFNTTLKVYIKIVLLIFTIVIVAAALPVKRVTSMRPIDAIRNK